MQDQKAKVEQNGILRFDNLEYQLPDLVKKTTLCDLSHLGLLRVGGLEAETFLQGQLSNDISEVREHHSQLSAYCSQKGRMLAVLRILMRENAYYLQLPQERLEAITPRLQMFVLRTKAEISPEKNLVSIGVAGVEADKILLNCVPTLPEKINDVTSQAHCSVVRLPGEVPRFWILGNATVMRTLWKNLQPAAIPVDPKIWKLHEIRAGLPTVYNVTADAFVPQMANMDLVQGLNFKKGCYVGQEIVARTHYLGKLKRRMHKAYLETNTSPKVGSDLYGDKSKQSAGKIVEIQEIRPGQYELLAVIKSSSLDEGQVHIHDCKGPSLLIQNLPYPLSLVKGK